MIDFTTWGLAWVSIFLVVGLGILFLGGHMLVLGSTRLAHSLGIHPVIIGLTVVALGTSIPEFVVSMTSAIKGSTDMAIGNIVGSNVTNIGLILGLSALIRPLPVNSRLLKFEVPFVIGISVFLWVVCFNGILGRFEGIFLLLVFLVYLGLLVKGARRESPPVRDAYHHYLAREHHIPLTIILILIGIGGLALGGNWAVDSALEISRRLGVPELLIGLTILALGSSLPELATSLIAFIKKEVDIGAGNIVGSNLFNIMAIGGSVSVLNPIPVKTDLISYHLPAMVIITLALFPFFKTGYRLSRVEGIVLVLGYIGIMGWWMSLN